MLEMNEEEILYVAQTEAKKSNCPRTKVGCVIVKNNRVLLAAHNNELKGLAYCQQYGCQRIRDNIKSGTNMSDCRGIHAEQKLIVECALQGINPTGCEIYSTHLPCSTCAKILIEAGIRKITYIYDYPNSNAKELFFEVGIACVKRREPNAK